MPKSDLSNEQLMRLAMLSGEASRISGMLAEQFNRVFLLHDERYMVNRQQVNILFEVFDQLRKEVMPCIEDNTKVVAAGQKPSVGLKVAE